MIIAHRLSTIRNADKICVIKDGRLIEEGTHESLIQDFPQGTYASLDAKQRISEEQNQAEDSEEEEELLKNI